MSPIKELRAVDAALKEYELLPADVHIGKNGTADKVVWMIRRLKMVERELKKRMQQHPYFIGGFSGDLSSPP